MLNALELFTGVGGITLGLHKWIKPVCYCENEVYAQSVLLDRMRDGSLPDAPIWTDVRSLRGQSLPEVDIIVAGFPCQDISVAGNGRGLEGKRSGLFFEVLRLAKEIKPVFIFLENVPAIRTRGASRVCQELASLGYDMRWTTLSAEEVGANHKRERWFLLAYSNGDELRIQPRWSSRQDRQETLQLGNHGEVEHVANIDCIGGREGRTAPEILERKSDIIVDGWWHIEPDVDRVVNGLPFRVDRIKCMGNAVVPLQAQTAFKELMGLI